jgi:hypothetical protein
MHLRYRYVCQFKMNNDSHPKVFKNKAHAEILLLLYYHQSHDCSIYGRIYFSLLIDYCSLFFLIKKTCSRTQIVTLKAKNLENLQLLNHPLIVQL